MCSRGLRTSLLSVVVGAVTVEGMSLTARSGGSSLARVITARSSQTSATRLMSMSVDAGVDATRYTTFIKEKVCIHDAAPGGMRVCIYVCALPRVPFQGRMDSWGSLLPGTAGLRVLVRCTEYLCTAVRVLLAPVGVLL